MDKIIKINFEEWQDAAYVDEGLVSWNYGQILQVEGLTLPDGNIEVHFSLTDREGDANVYIGTVKDNVLTVSIPDFIFQKEDVYQPTYDAYAFVYQTDETSGRTIKKITFTIKGRPEPTTGVPEPKQDQFLEEVRKVMAETKDIAKSVRDDADNGKFSGIPGAKGDDGKSAYDYAVEGGFKGTEQEFTDLMAQAGHVDLTGYVTKEEHEAELLKAMIKVTTDKAPFHHITDSANMKVVDFGMEGKTEQETVPGNQLFDINGDINKAFNGTDSSVISNTVENNILTTTGENSLQKSYGQCFTNLNGKTITIAAKCVSLGTNTSSALMTLCEDGVFVKNIEIKGVNTTTLLVHAVTSDNFVILFTNVDGTGAQFTDIKVYEGSYTTSTIPEWEPYVGGMPSPNPEHEEDITLAGVYNEETGRYEHKCCVGNVNLFDESKLTGGEFVEFNGVRCYKYRDNTDYIYYNGKFSPNAQYTITMRLYRESNDSTKHTNITLEYIDGSEVNIVLTPGDIVTYTSTAGKSVSRIKSSASYSTVTYLDLSVMQIERGLTPTNYTPHASQQFTITSDRPLTMWDNLVKVDGKWYWDYKQLKFSIKSLPNGVTMSDDFKGCYFQLNNLPKSLYRDGFCNQLINDMNVNDKRPNIMWLGRNNNVLYIVNSSFYDDTLEDKGLANWKAHLNEHPLEIYTYKDESELVPLPDEEQTLLNNLETYYGVTNVYNEQGCPMWLTYVADTKLYVDKKLLEIQSAMI